jgi:Domain of unknown function (DUF4386)
MNPTRRVEITTGVLFILATVASLTATTALPSLEGSDYLTRVASHHNQLATAALLHLIAAGGSVGIAITLYPTLKKFKAGLAAGSLVFRTIEAMFYTARVVNLLSILSLSQNIAKVPATDRAAYQTIGDSLVATCKHAALVAVFAFCVGSFMYYTVFYQTRLVPRWLSGWGIGAAALLMAACLLALFHNTAVTGYVALAAPIGVQEMVFALWLLIKGFVPSAVRSTSPPESPTVSLDSPREVMAR